MPSPRRSRRRREPTSSRSRSAPVLRGLLLTGGAPAFLRAELGGGRGDTSIAQAEALWWPPGKIVGRYLAPFLAERGGLILTPPSGAEAIPVDVAVAS